MGSNMVNRFTIKPKNHFVAFLLFLCAPFASIFGQCNNINDIGFLPLDTVLCEGEATVSFQSLAVLDSTPVFLSNAVSTASFQSFFSYDFQTNNDGCFYYLEIAGSFTVWSNTPGYYDAFGYFNINSNQFISEGVIDNFTSTPPMFIAPNTYNPNHIYQYYYLGDGSAINVTFSDSNEYPDNNGSMTFDWYAVPCFEYLWDFGDNNTSTEINPTHTYNTPGTYQVTLTITDLYNGCSDNFASTVTVNPSPIIDLGENTTVCDNQTITLDATTPNASYFWQNGTTDPTLEVNQTGLYWVDVTVQGCTTRDSVEITVLNSIVNDLSATICQGDDFAVGNNIYTQTGSYADTLISNEGCDSIVNLDLNVINVDAIINAPLTLDCNNSSIDLDGSGSSIGQNISYLWITQNGNILNGANTLNPEIDGPGLYQLIVTYDDGFHACASSDTVTVFENLENPIANAGPDQTLNCSSNTLILDGSNSSTGNEFVYQWTSFDGNIVSNENTLNPVIDQGGNYTLVVTNELNGCTDSDEVVVNEQTLSISDFVIEFEVPSCIINDGFIVIQPLSSNEIYEFSIDGGQTFSPDPVFDFLIGGIYEIVIKNEFGCEVSQVLTLPPPTDLEIILEPEATIQFGEIYSIDAEINIPEDSIASIIWEPAIGLSCTQCLNPEASPTSSTSYNLTVIGNNGCQASAQIYFEVKKSRRVYIPNAFTPLNKDGNNDVFKIYVPQEQVQQISSFKIFNRWGELVYEANEFLPDDQNVGWDGSFKGEMLQPGVFVYYIEMIYIDGKVVNYKGDVSIIN